MNKRPSGMCLSGTVSHQGPYQMQAKVGVVELQVPLECSQYTYPTRACRCVRSTLQQLPSSTQQHLATSHLSLRKSALFNSIAPIHTQTRTPTYQLNTFVPAHTPNPASIKGRCRPPKETTVLRQSIYRTFSTTRY